MGKIGISVIIPTNQPESNRDRMTAKIHATIAADLDAEVIATCKDMSAACNRNLGLAQSSGEYVIMIDDDIRPKANGWAQKLIECLNHDKRRRIISARLLNADGTPGTMISYRDTINKCPSTFWENENVILPSACIAFRRSDWVAISQNPSLPDNFPFDTHYERACGEDSDFCMAMNQTFPDTITGVCKSVPIVHLNAEVWRVPGFDWKKNHDLFRRKWNRDPY